MFDACLRQGSDGPSGGRPGKRERERERETGSGWYSNTSVTWVLSPKIPAFCRQDRSHEPLAAGPRGRHGDVLNVIKGLIDLVPHR